MSAAVDEAKSAARQAEDSKPVEGLARFGLGARGVVYTVIGLLALQIAVQGRGKADRDGALAAIKDKPFGGTLLVVLAIAFAGYACWRLLQGVVGHRDEDAGAKRTAKRISSLVRAVLYAFFAVSTLRFLASGPTDDKAKPFTARALALPGGQVIVALLGLAIIGGGLYAAYRGVRTKFLKRLDLGTASSTTRTVVQRIGIAGLVGRGLVLCLLGGFLFAAAVTFDPDKAKGLDEALKTLAAEPYGQFLLLGAAICLLAFGAWSFVEARYRKV
ncbi:MAG: DUF1206 domain-containing protein [Actinomycetota bacterium]|nr:DUF1206 domain-containing protein [Actinomycetota bacterium]